MEEEEQTSEMVLEEKEQTSENIRQITTNTDGHNKINRVQLGFVYCYYPFPLLSSIPRFLLLFYRGGQYMAMAKTLEKVAESCFAVRACICGPFMDTLAKV